MSNHAGSTLTQPVVKPFSHRNARLSCSGGRVVLGTQDHITGALETLEPRKFYSAPSEKWKMLP